MNRTYLKSAACRGGGECVRLCASIMLLAIASCLPSQLFSAVLESSNFTDLNGNYNQGGKKITSSGFENITAFEEIGASAQTSPSFTARTGIIGKQPIPARINDLRVNTVSTFSVTLEWTAPAGDWERDAADVTRYILRYSTQPILTHDDFSNAAAYAQNWTPLTRGSAENHVVYDLYSGTTYYFVVESVNEHIVRSERSVQASTCTKRATNPRLAQIYKSSIAVTWTSVEPVNGYVLEASTTSDFANVAQSSSTLSSSLTMLTLSGLEFNTTYHLRLNARELNGPYYALTTPASTSTLANEPGLASPVFTEVWLSSITAQWTAGTPPNHSGTEYILEASSASFQASAKIISKTAAGLSAAADTLLGNTTYQFRVKAVNQNGVPTGYITLGATATLASPPINIAAYSTTVGSIKVAWTPTDANGYILEASETDFAGSVVYSSASLSQNADSLSISGLNANTTYYFRVGAYNCNSRITYSLSHATSTLSVPLTFARFANVYVSTVVVAWNALPASPQSQTAEGYLVEASTAQDFTGVIYASAASKITLNTLAVNGLDLGTTYYFRIGTLNWNDVPNYYAFGSTFTKYGLMINNFRASPDFKKIILEWDPIDEVNPLFSNYQIYRSSVSGLNGELVAQTTHNIYIDTAVIVGTTDYYRASILLTNGTEIAFSRQVQAYIIAAVPLPPLALDINNTSPATVTLNWLPPAAYINRVMFPDPFNPETPSEIFVYRIYRSTQPRDAPWMLMAEVSSTTLSWSDTALNPEDDYYYHVLVANSTGLSGKSMIRSRISKWGYVVAADNKTMLEIPLDYLTPYIDKARTNNLNSVYSLNVSSHPEELGGRVLKSLEYDSYRSGLVPENIKLGGWAYLHMYFDKAGSVIVPSGKGALAAQPAAIVPTSDQISIYWHNGSKWLQLYGKADGARQEITIKTAMLGKYQLRSVERLGGFNMDQAGLSNRLITPNNDGKNDAVTIIYDNPRDSFVSGKIYDLKGAFVSEMRSGNITNTIEWDAKANGQTVPGGVYIFQIEAESKVYNGTVVVVK